MTKYDIAAAIATEGLDGFYGKMSAEMQRRVFGRAFFGRKTLDIDTNDQGTVTVTWRAGGPVSETLFATVTFDQIARGDVRLN